MKTSVMQGRARTVDPHTGIEIPDRALLVDGLATIMADSSVLQFKTRVVSWNVVGPLFIGLHDLAERQERDLFDAVDTLARRVRTLGYPAPERLTALIERSELDEESGVVRGSAQDMIDQLARDHETIACTIRTVAGWAEQMKDQATLNLLSHRLQRHEEAVWVLQSLLVT